jgi:hypothetical protein
MVNSYDSKSWNAVTTLTIPCPSCGAENRDVANYCLKCRTPLIESVPLPQTMGGAASSGSWNVIMAFMACKNHPFKPSQVTCLDCGVPVCFECSRTIYCLPCYRRHVLVSELRLPVKLGAGTFYRLF